jgi:hypothetical protein
MNGALTEIQLIAFGFDYAENKVQLIRKEVTKALQSAPENKINVLIEALEKIMEEDCVITAYWDGTPPETTYNDYALIAKNALDTWKGKK